MDSEKANGVARPLDELRRQAQLFYQERAQAPIPTSESLSVRRYVWLSLGFLLALGILLYVLGSRANSKPDTGHELPERGELSSLPPSPPEEPVKRATAAQLHSAPAPPAERPSRNARETPRPPAVTKNGPHSPKDLDPIRDVQAESRPEVISARSATAPKAEATPGVDPAERDRQQLGHDMVVEKNRSLAQMISNPDDSLRFQRWEARPASDSVYIVQFIFLDERSKAPANYVWQVDIKSGKVVPLSHLARQLA